MTNEEESLDSLAAWLLASGGEEFSRNFEPYAAKVRALLAMSPASVPDHALYLRCISHVEAHCNWRWDPRTAAFRDPCSRALEAWCAEPNQDLEILCVLFDLSYFLTWCFTQSNIDQSHLILPDMRRLAARTGAPKASAPIRRERPLTVCYLTRMADPASALTVCTRHVVEALASRPDLFRPVLFVAERMDAHFPQWLSSAPVPVRSVKLPTRKQTIDRLSALLASEGVDILLTDMNSAIATVLFSRRSAPLQGFVQIGLPAWGTVNLDVVFNAFGIDAATAGWESAAVHDFLPPWDLEGLSACSTDGEVAALRASLPPTRFVIGCYARLIKFTDAYLQSVERILIAYPDAVCLLGGTGDAAHVERFMSESSVGNRVLLRKEFVNGHVWARVLDVFLDTWPFQGGGSVREVMVRSVPVVSIASAEMPTLSKEKDATLIASDWDGFVSLTTRLLQDPAFLDAARERAGGIATTMADRARFQTEFVRDLQRSIADAEVRS